jgi:hypothetical protein
MRKQYLTFCDSDRKKSLPMLQQREAWLALEVLWRKVVGPERQARLRKRLGSRTRATRRKQKKLRRGRSTGIFFCSECETNAVFDDRILNTSASLLYVCAHFDSGCEIYGRSRFNVRNGLLRSDAALQVRAILYASGGAFMCQRNPLYLQGGLAALGV